MLETREAQSRARAAAQAHEVALQPDADAHEELTGQGMEVDDARAASQENQAQARQGPAARASRAVVRKHRVLPNVRSSRESLETWVLLTWMSRDSGQK